MEQNKLVGNVISGTPGINLLAEAMRLTIARLEGKAEEAVELHGKWSPQARAARATVNRAKRMLKNIQSGGGDK